MTTLGETDGAGAVTATYVRGMGYIAKIGAASGTSYYQYNAHGDVVAVASGADGHVQNRYEYDIFGMEILGGVEEVENSIRYAGEFYDASAGLYYLRARYYDPATARFTSEDTYPGNVMDPASLNLYTYCGNDPVNYTDPTGHWAYPTGALKKAADSLHKKATGGGSASSSSKSSASSGSKESGWDDLIGKFKAFVEGGSSSSGSSRSGGSDDHFGTIEDWFKGGGADSSISGLLPGLPGYDIDPGFSIKAPFDSSYDPGFSMWNTDEIMEAIKQAGESLKDLKPKADGALTPLSGSGGGSNGGRKIVYRDPDGSVYKGTIYEYILRLGRNYFSLRELMAILRDLGYYNSVWWEEAEEKAYTYLGHRNADGSVSTYEISYYTNLADGPIDAYVNECGGSRIGTFKLYYENNKAYVYLPDLVRFMGSGYSGNLNGNTYTYWYDTPAPEPAPEPEPYNPGNSGGAGNTPSGPTLMEAAELADHVYYTKSFEEAQKDSLPGDWKLVDVKEEGSLKIGVYARTVGGQTEYVLVNRGTQNWAWSADGDDNAKQLFGDSQDVWNSRRYAEKFIEEHSGANITFVGHSKGGAEAAVNAVATNKNSILFNPATVNLSAYGLNSSDYFASMTAYIVKGEILNSIFGPVSKPIDKVEYLPTQYKTPTNDALATTSYPLYIGNKLYNATKDAIDNHLMVAVKKAIIEWEGNK